MRRAIVTLVVAAAAAALLPLRPPSAAAGIGDVRVAVLDSGIRAGHPAFAPGQVVAWRDFRGGCSTPCDDHGHGTAVASIAAGPHGWAQGAKLIVGKVLDAEGNLDRWGRLADAIRWAADAGADVINVSIWGQLPSPADSVTLAGSIDYATTTRDALVVWIAGNGDDAVLDRPGTPGSVPSTVLPGASSPQVLVVGAADAAGRRASWSQWDPEVLAWGDDVTVACYVNSTCSGAYGTSFAAPRMASAAARLRAEGAPRDPDWLKWVLLHAAADDVDVPYAEEGYGFFDGAALNRARAAIGGSPPPADSRDAFHAASAAARTAQTATVPAGLLP